MNGKLCLYKYGHNRRGKKWTEGQSEKLRPLMVGNTYGLGKLSPLKGKPMPEAQRLKLVQAWAKKDPKVREQHLSAFVTKPKHHQNNSLEIAVANWLGEHRLEYKRNKYIKPYFVDFFVPSMNLIIEADGCYWHGCEKCGYKGKYDWIKEQQRHLFLANHCPIVRLKEHDIKAGNIVIPLLQEVS